MRVFTHTAAPEAGSYRRWWHFYAQDDAGPCGRCNGTGFPALRATGNTPASVAVELRLAGADDAEIDRLRCTACTGTGRKVDERDVGEVTLEATTNRHGFAHVGFTLNDERDVVLEFAVPKVVAVWLGLEYKPLGFGWRSRNPLRYLFVRGRPEHAGGTGIRKGLLGYTEREFGIEASRGQVRLKLGVDPMGGTSNRLHFRRRYPREWLRDVRETGTIIREDRRGYARRTDPKTLFGRYLRWRHWLPEVGFEITLLRYDWRDQVLGRHTLLRTEPITEGEPAVVPMPEGNYPCRVTLKTSTYGRARWPWSRRARPTAEVEMDVPVPEPGKGENSWDIDDDACHSLSGPYRSISEATAAVASTVMRQRERYGSGQRWEPSAGWPEGVLGHG